MSDDSRVQQLIEEILESGNSVEEVCRDSPELLPQVRRGWRKLRAIQAQLGEMFPEPGSTEDHEATPSEVGQPHIPGYQIGEILGCGGVGVVYKALHLSLNRTVALKMLLAWAWATRAERHRFSREAEVVAGLRHPNIVQIYDVGDLDGRPFFTMELVEGGTLAVGLGVVAPVPEDRGRTARGAGDAVRPPHVADGLEALGVVEEVLDVDHRATPRGRDVRPYRADILSDRRGRL